MTRLVKVDDRGERNRLVAAGGVVVKRRRMLVLPLWPAAADMAVGSARSFAAGVGELVELHQLAYNPDHPDRVEAEDDPGVAAAYFESLLDGTLVGPFIAHASAEVRDAQHRLDGFVVVSDHLDDELYSGAWVSELEVRPIARRSGVGRDLMAFAIAALARAGYPAVGLAVTVGLPAERLYERLGFEDTGHGSWVVEVAEPR